VSLIAGPTDDRPKVGAGARQTLSAVWDLAQRAIALLSLPASLRGEARQQVDMLNADAVRSRLRRQPINRLKAVAGPGVRLSQLERAGFRTVADVLDASASALDSVPGVGPKTVEQVVDAARTTAQRVNGDTQFRFDPDRPDAAQTRLLAILAAIRAADAASASLRQPLQQFLDQTKPLVHEAERTGSRLRMFFSRSAARDGALDALAQLEAILADPRVVRLGQAVAESSAAGDPDSYRPEHLWPDYLADAASVYSVLSTVGVRSDPHELDAARGFIPEELRQQISAVPLDTSLLTATLRGYQVFGAQYAIHRERSILGDEMGLGKTVQALAVVAHLAARGQRRFLVVCPASVQVNWLNETAKHTRLTAYRLHGADRDREAMRWLHSGGVGVTTLGTLARLPAEVVNAGVSLLVVDEAHFIKNPEAARTKAVVATLPGAHRVLFLTGTPMENRVEEFRNLVGYLQPHVAARVDARDVLAGARAFRRAVAPVYLRRNQIDVLSELPEKIEVEDWVQHSAEDETAYAAAVFSRNLMAMRQAAYQSARSAKLDRLSEIVEEAIEDGMKVVIFSFFLGVLDVVARRLGPTVVGVITGAVPPALRQQTIDDFSRRNGPGVLLSQIEAGGVGMNMQAASVVILTEPQWKPSTEDQAVARAHRMGQVRTVQVHRLLAKGGVDERIREVQENKSLLFDEFARKSDAKDADPRAIDIAEHRPPGLDDPRIPLERRVVMAEEYRLTRSAA
jgi:superfamily II DNA or RNA helicase